MSTNRHIVTVGIILKTYIFREIDRNFIFISPELGIQRATAFGACKLKSRFCSTVQPFTSAKLFLYYNPQDNSYKLEDITEVNTNDLLKTDIKKIYLLSYCFDMITQSLLSEEDYKSYYYLVVYTMDLLSKTDNYKTSYLFFVCKYLFLAGYIPRLDGCVECGRSEGPFAFSLAHGGLVCSACHTQSPLPIDRQSIVLFDDFLQKKFVELRTLVVGEECFNQLYRITQNIIAAIFEQRLKTTDNLKFVF